MNYQLLDSGDCERLENFGGVICRRPAPVAVWRRANEKIWQAADAVFDGDKWRGQRADNLREWEFIFRGAAREWRMALNLGAHGQIGIFPEQMPNWRWLDEICAAAPRLKILNLFAHTGAATLACAVAGATVCHLDAAASAIKQARRNAEISGLKTAPIRWLAEDARKFLRREIHRENFYDGVIIDPPAFGRAGKNAWKLSRDLPELFDLTRQVLARSPRFILFSCHDPNYLNQRDNFADFFPPLKKLETVPLTISGECHALPLGKAWRGIF